MYVAHLDPRLIRGVPAVAGIAVAAIATALPVLCPFRVWSGHACPLCGMTRAVGSFATGDVDTAVRYHPLVLLVALQAFVIGLFYARNGSRPPASLMPWLVGINAAAFMVTWLVRWRLDLLSFVLS